MLHEKRYGLILDTPSLHSDRMFNIIETVYLNNLIPIIILTDTRKNGNYLNVYNKISIFRNKFNRLREDNFIILREEFVSGTANYNWKFELRDKIYKINKYAFGTDIDGVDDKMFIINLDKHLVIGNNVLLVNKIDNFITDLVNIADISNIKSIGNDKFYPYITTIFKDRTEGNNVTDIIYGGDTEFFSNIKTIASNKTYVYTIDDSYIDLIRKYNLGRLLYSEYEKVINVESEDMTNVINFLNAGNIKYRIQNTEYATTNDNVQKIVIEN